MHVPRPDDPTAFEPLEPRCHLSAAPDGLGDTIDRFGGLRDAVAADVNGDGRADVVVAAEDRLHVFRQLRPGAYRRLGGVRDADTGADRVLLAAGRLGAGSRADVVAFHPSTDAEPGRLRLFRGSPRGLRAAGEVETGVAPGPVRVADLDGDGVDEVVLQRASDLAVYGVRDGTLSFLASVAPQVAFSGIFDIGDLDADGDPDIALGVGAGLDEQILLLRNDGALVFTPWAARPVARPDLQSVLIADLDGDGRNDVLYTSVEPDGPNYTRRIGVHVGGIDGVFRGPVFLYTSPDFAETGRPASDAPVFRLTTLSDLDADGDTDLLVDEAESPSGSPAVHVRGLRFFPRESGKGFRAGTLLYPATAAAPADPARAVFRVSDLDRDGDADVLLLDAATGRVAAARTQPAARRPVIGAVTTSASSVLTGQSFTVAASDAFDPDEIRGGTILSVAFYADTNGNRRWDRNDKLLGTDFNGADGWSVTTAADRSFRRPRLALFARPRDEGGRWGEPAATHRIEINAAPTIASVGVRGHAGEPLAVGRVVTLQARGVRDDDPGGAGAVEDVAFFLDSNHSGVYDAGDRYLGADGSRSGSTRRLRTLVTSDWGSPGEQCLVLAIARDNRFLWNYQAGSVLVTIG